MPMAKLTAAQGISFCSDGRVLLEVGLRVRVRVRRGEGRVRSGPPRGRAKVSHARTGDVRDERACVA